MPTAFTLTVNPSSHYSYETERRFPPFRKKKKEDKPEEKSCPNVSSGGLRANAANSISSRREGTRIINSRMYGFKRQLYALPTINNVDARNALKLQRVLLARVYTFHRFVPLIISLRASVKIVARARPIVVRRNLSTFRSLLFETATSTVNIRTCGPLRFALALPESSCRACRSENKYCILFLWLYQQAGRRGNTGQLSGISFRN